MKFCGIKKDQPNQYVLEYIKQGDKEKAIKAYRKISGAKLGAAKEYIDRLTFNTLTHI